MDDLEISSDSERTIIGQLEKPNSNLIEDVIMKRYAGVNNNGENFDKILHLERDLNNKYDLNDFSEDDIIKEPLFKRIKSKDSPLEKVRSWQDNFNIGDFCQDSNDIPECLQQESDKNEYSQPERIEFEGIFNFQNKYSSGPSTSSQDSTSNSQDSLESPEDLLKKLSAKYGSSNKEKIYENLALKNSNHLKKIKLSSATTSQSQSTDVASLSSSNLPESEYSGNFGSFDQYCGKEIVDREAGTKKKGGRCGVGKEQQKLEKELAKQAKKREREQKKIEADREKARRNALKTVQNSFKPEECLKNIIVNLDMTVLSMEYEQILTKSLQTAPFTYRHISHDHSEMITWTRKIQTLEDMNLQNKDQNENFVLKIFKLPDFLKQIENDTLVAQLVSIIATNKKLIVAVVGLQQYYRYIENKKSKSKDGFDFKNLPKISRAVIDTSITELQILTKCYFKSVTDYEGLSVFVLECTKSIAQIPYKMMKQKKYEDENEYFSGENRDCVNVDKHGNGLGRLWNQILTQFPLARLETSEAITSVYPTMAALFEAYENCNSVEEGESLLQNIPIRRAGGPLASVRKIGPELSKKVYNFFTSNENMFV